MTEMRDKIIAVVEEIETTLLEKNAAYGNSALEPVRIFSSADPTEQLKVRIDDKLSRLAKGTNTHRVPEDTLMDLIGYLVLLVIAQRGETISTKGSYTASFQVTDVDPEAWATIFHNGTETMVPVKMERFSGPRWGDDHS